ncbi:2-phospho-L-lactate guanylyltransferase [Cryobacterium sp. PH31-O1]|uniref:2-phospho-L-lactate guanylyltransferase n=1 Tax=Cryobacterium sp. PH31-O1 TaxID=3046306 RepID=UPI0024B98D6F|nr:2-phospho-L-lactate guanylyltransferase [Cryobacterium sp. PH31-O1]MDJ0339701.1 2-phospho-L-lactate guanylyltransferase [Cryobacterium sp. PH31-O1]
MTPSAFGLKLLADSWVVVVPVKGSPGAKSRLGPGPGPGPGSGPESGAGRAALAEAFALDTVAAIVAASAVERVFVVTASARLGKLLAELGAVIVLEQPGVQTGHARLNAAIEQGIAAARHAYPQANLAVMTGDLPALRPTDLETGFVLAAGHPRSMVADAEGVGTTTLFARGGVAFTPRFGFGSRAAHEADGHAVLDLPSTSSLRLDVDTEADLAVARALGLGPCTSALL